MSNHIVYQWNCQQREGRIYNLATKQCLVEDVDWVALSEDGDSLAVFAKDGYRGFINRFEGQVVVQPACYTHAWVFAEGLAVVVEKGRLFFIDHRGKVVIDNGMMADVENASYLFSHGVCQVENQQHKGQWGVMDRHGQWVDHCLMKESP